jgi:hypothetical protein
MHLLAWHGGHFGGRGALLLFVLIAVGLLIVFRPGKTETK